VIARATGNMVLRAMMRDLHNVLAANWTSSRITPRQLESLAEQHAGIAEAIRLRDSAAARTAMEEHLLWARSVESARIDGEVPLSDGTGRSNRPSAQAEPVSTGRRGGARHR
jgi:DNA-binding FadR family transcriptional regulator